MPYICALCGANLKDAGEVEQHFRLYHPEERGRINMLRERPLRPEALCRALRRAGLLVNENGLRSQRTVHTCALCGKRFATVVAVVVHFIVRHPAALPPKRATAKEVYYLLVRRGLIRSTPPDGVLNRSGNNGGLPGDCSEELLAVLAAYLAGHEGAVATVKPRQLAPMVLTPYATILATALSRLLRLQGTITDARGRRWLLIRAEKGWCGWRFLLTRA